MLHYLWTLWHGGGRGPGKIPRASMRDLNLLIDG